LGFAGPLIAQWCADAGAEVVATRELAPSATGQKGKLTVSLWVARRQRAAEAITGDQHKLERIA
jgi:predicted Fe-Mo cluster-binding NifX family protein